MTETEAVEWCGRMGAVVIFPKGGDGGGYQIAVGERAVVFGPVEMKGLSVHVEGAQVFITCATFEAAVSSARDYYLKRIGPIDGLAIAYRETADARSE